MLGSPRQRHRAVFLQEIEGAYMCVSMFVFLVVLTSCLPPVDAKGFLSGQRFTVEELDNFLLWELPDSAEHLAKREELQPMFLTLPKNPEGRLDAPSVRYALHRYFVHKHGWHVKGLDPEGAGWKSNPADLTQEWAPVYIQRAFEKRLQGHGLDLGELASFAVVLSNLIFGDGVGALEDIYRALDYPFDRPVSPEQIDFAFRGYVAGLIASAGYEAKVESNESVFELEKIAGTFDPAYPDIVTWMRDTRMSRRWYDRSRHNPFRGETVSFDEATDYMKDLLHRFGSITASECLTEKLNLLDLEEADNGRVPLGKFYSHAEVDIKESPDYLRNLGVLEEGRGSPRLIVPNYLTSPCRCLPFTGYFSVCCPNECEDLMGKIERALRAPAGSPKEIADIVSKVPSDTVMAPWNISGALMSRLDEIAQHHHGQVPVHGRLFAQWMHHAYPRECSFPHASGTVNPVSQVKWLEIHQDINNVLASEEQRQHYIQTQSDEEANIDAIPWTAVEELVAEVNVTSSTSRIWKGLPVVMGLMLLVSFVTPLARACSTFHLGDTKIKSTSIMV